MKRVAPNDMRFVDLTPLHRELLSWVNNERWPESISTPYPEIAFGFRLKKFEVKYTSLTSIPKTPPVTNFMKCEEQGFVVTRSDGGLRLTGYALVPGYGLANIKPPAEFTRGQIGLMSPMSPLADLSIYEQVVLQWVRRCLGFLVMLENGQFHLTRDPRRSSFLFARKEGEVV